MGNELATPAAEPDCISGCTVNGFRELRRFAAELLRIYCEGAARGSRGSRATRSVLKVVGNEAQGYCRWCRD